MSRQMLDKEMADTFKTHIQSQLDEFVQNNKDEKLPSEKVQEEQCKQTCATEAEMKELKNDVNNLDQDYESRMTDVNTRMKTLESEIKQDYESRCKALDAKISSMQTQMTEMNERQPPNEANEATSESGETIEDENEQEMRINDTTKLIMCMDSNSKYLDRRKLWDLDGTEHKKCYTLSQVSRVVERNIEYRNLKHFLISVGCNDLETKEPEEVFNDIRDIAS